MSYDLSAERRALRNLEDSVGKSTEEMKLYESFEARRLQEFQEKEKALRERISELEQENSDLIAENARLRSDLEQLRNNISWKM